MLLREIETFLKVHRMPPARFGREAVGDPSFVFRLKQGRTARGSTIAKVQAYIRTHAEHDPC